MCLSKHLLARASRLAALVAMSCAAVAAFAQSSVPPAASPQSAGGSSAEVAKDAKVKPLRVAQAAVAQPQGSAAEPTAPTQQLREVTVTGSRVIQSALNSPSPITTFSATDVQLSGNKDISEFVNELPQVQDSYNLTAFNSFNGQIGVTSPALRGIGANHTLVLLNGQRVVPSTTDGMVNTASFPEMLIKRVDVVTNGGSSVYGSDALAGVINYVLDTDFTGFKVQANGGVTQYGDDDNKDFGAIWGAPFADGRGHIEVSAEYYDTEGIRGCTNGCIPARSWYYDPPVMMENPNYTATNGLPFYTVLPNNGNPFVTKGGIINSGPLQGTAFNQNGQPYTFDYGIVDPTGTRMSGGDWLDSNMSGNTVLDAPVERTDLFSYISFNLTENLQLYTQLSNDYEKAWGNYCCVADPSITINAADNPFLPASIKSAAATAGVSSFSLGTFLDPDGGLANSQGTEHVNRFVGGLKDVFTLFGKDYNLDAYYEYGDSDSFQARPQQYNVTNFNEAVDAITNPKTGAPECRIALTNPSTACVPYNPFGWVVTPQMLAWLEPPGDNEAWQHVPYKQEVASATVTGEPFSLWAGPVSLAFGATHRMESIHSTVDQYSQQMQWMLTNYAPLDGSYTVNEGYVETLIPLAKDEPFAKSLQFNGAARATDYSQSGYVTTWKAGLVWQPIDDLRVRTALSRDISAPNIQDLYALPGGPVLFNNLFDPFHNRVNTFGEVLTGGNPDLQPEKASNLDVGLVLTPRFLPGFYASVDYWRMLITGWISTPPVNAQQIVNYCYAGLSAFCSGIERDPTTQEITYIVQQPINFVSQHDRGIDFEAGYQMPASRLVQNLPGSLNFRLTGTRYIQGMQAAGLGTPPDNHSCENEPLIVVTAGVTPCWVMRLSATYVGPRLTIGLTGRAISSGVVNNEWVQCNSNCPASTLNNPTVPVGANEMPSAFYLDGAFAYTFGKDHQLQMYLDVKNMFNRSPPTVAPNPYFPVGGDTEDDGGLFDNDYDTLGREYHVGVSYTIE